MAHNARSFPCGKYSNLKNIGSHLLQNKGYVQNIADKDDKFLRESCILDWEFYSVAENANRRRSSFGTVSGSEQMLFRRPRLVRGLYLGKEPLEYQRSPTPFRFSFQTLTSNKDTADKENDKVRSFKRKTVYSKSMTVRLCNLQTRPAKRRELKQNSAVWNSSAASISDISAGEVVTTRASNTKRVPPLDQHPKKQVPLSFGKEAKNTIDLKEADKVGLNGKSSRQLQKRRHVEREKAGMPRSDYLKGKNNNPLQFGTGPFHVEELTGGTGKISAEYGLDSITFKLSDYDIWSRKRKTC